MHLFRRYFCFLIPVFLLFSCENSSPELITTSAQVVFDYDTADSAPSVRLSVFTEAGSDVRRASEIKITAQKSGYEWTVTDPRLIGANNRQWAGYADIEVPPGEKIEQGPYTLAYTDAGGRTAQNVFAVSYPDKLIGSRSADVKRILGNEAKEQVAVYLSDGTLVYFGERKQEWKTNDEIWNAVKLAAGIRTCWTSADGTVMCLMPEQKRPGE